MSDESGLSLRHIPQSDHQTEAMPTLLRGDQDFEMYPLKLQGRKESWFWVNDSPKQTSHVVWLWIPERLDT